MRRWVGTDRDAGTTMAELVVVMFVLAILAAATATLTIGFERTTAQSMQRQDQIDSGRHAVDRMTKTLRSTVRFSQLGCSTCTQEALETGAPFRMVFYANIDSRYSVSVPSRVTYEVPASGPNAGVLVEKIQEPDQAAATASGWTYCSAEAPGASAACKSRLRTSVLARGIRATGSPVFSYFRQDNTLISVPPAGLGGADLSEAIAVELQLTATSTGAVAAQPTTFVQRVLLTNSFTLLRPDPEATP